MDFWTNHINMDIHLFVFHIQMSFIQSTIKCVECGKEMNVAFGIVGMTQVAEWPIECPKCKSTNLKKISEGWNAKPNEQNTD